jgi:hypothetical protein
MGQVNAGRNEIWTVAANLTGCAPVAVRMPCTAMHNGFV